MAGICCSEPTISSSVNQALDSTIFQHPPEHHSPAMIAFKVARHQEKRHGTAGQHATHPSPPVTLLVNSLQSRAEQMLHSKPPPWAQEVCLRISCVSHCPVDTVPKANAINRRSARAVLPGTEDVFRAGHLTYLVTSLPTRRSSLLLQMLLKGVIQVSTICPSNNKADSP